MVPGKAFWAQALESSHLVQAGPTVKARLVGAIVDIDLAAGSGKSFAASTSKGARTINASRAVEARRRGALVDIKFTSAAQRATGETRAARSLAQPTGAN